LRSRGTESVGQTVTQIAHYVISVCPEADDDGRAAEDENPDWDC